MSIKRIISLILFIYAGIGFFATAGMIVLTASFQLDGLTPFIGVVFVMTFVCFFVAVILSPSEKNQDHDKLINYIDNNKNKQAQLNNSHYNSSKYYNENTASKNSFDNINHARQMEIPAEINGHLPPSDRLKEKFGSWDCSSREMYLAMNYAYNLGYDTGYADGYRAGDH